MGKILRCLIIQGAQAVACSGFPRILCLTLDKCSLTYNAGSVVTSTECAEFDHCVCVCVSLMANAPFLSQVLNELEEVCTVMRSLSSVIQSELLSGSLPRETGREKSLVNI